MHTRRRKSPNSKSRSSLLCGAALLSVLASGTASADSADKDDASENDACMSDAICRAHYNRARKLSKKDDYEGALEAYEAAYRRKPVPWLLINLGRSLHKLGRTQDAIVNYQQFLGEKDPKPELKQKAEQFLREAQTDLVNKPVKERPPKEKAPTDAGTAGGPGNLPPTAETGQGEPSSGASGGSGTGKGEPKTTALSVTPNESVSASPSVATPTTPKSRLGPLFYGGLAVGGALIAGGVITGIVGLSSANTLQSTPYAGPVDGSSLSALQSRVRGLGYATDILIPVGVATIAITTIVSLVRKPAVENRPPPVAAMDFRPAVASTGSVGAKVETPSAPPVVIPATPMTPTPPVAAATPVVAPTAPLPSAPSPTETPSAAATPNPTP